MDYEKAYKDALEKIREGLQPLPDGAKISGVTRAFLEEVFPELKESEGERIRKEIIDFLWKEKIFLQEAHSSVENNPKYRFVMDAIAWLEKQGEQPSAIRWYDVSLIPQELEELLVEWDSEDATWHEIAFYHADTKTFWDGTRQVENVTRWCYIIDLLEKQGEKKAIMNVPTREVILSIWDLGNEWKELTNGSISTEYGTQLDYIQKHWHESEYYLREKQGEQNHTWSEEDEEILKNLIDYFSLDDGLRLPTEETIDWLKSLKERLS